jgi:hypothetical protein
MKKNKRLFPITEEVFNRKILPIIEGNYIWKAASARRRQGEKGSGERVSETGGRHWCPAGGLIARYRRGGVLSL